MNDNFNNWLSFGREFMASSLKKAIHNHFGLSLKCLCLPWLDRFFPHVFHHVLHLKKSVLPHRTLPPYHNHQITRNRRHWILAVKPRHLPNLQIFSFRWLHHFNDTFHFTSPTSHLCEKKWPTTGEFQREWRFFWGFPWVWTVLTLTLLSLIDSTC